MSNPQDQTIVVVTIDGMSDSQAGQELSVLCAKGFQVVGGDGHRVVLSNYKG